MFWGEKGLLWYNVCRKNFFVGLFMCIFFCVKYLVIFFYMLILVLNLKIVIWLNVVVLVFVIYNLVFFNKFEGKKVIVIEYFIV